MTSKQLVSRLAPAAAPLEPLLPLLGWLHRLLDWQVQTTRHTYGALADDPYRGLYVPDSEADLLRADWPALPADLLRARAELDDQRRAIARELAGAEAAGQPVPLLRLQRLFDLSDFECDVILLALAPELDVRYERLYAYLQDDVTRKRPSLDLALRLACHHPAERTEQRALLGPDGALIRQRLIQLADDSQRPGNGLARLISLDERITALLLGHSGIDPRIAAHVRLIQPAPAGGPLPAELPERLRDLLDLAADGLVIGLQGSYGSGRRALAEHVCAAMGVPLLEVRVDTLSATSLAPGEAIGRVVREARLSQALVLWDNPEAILHDETARAWRAALLEGLDTPGLRSLLILEQPWESRGAMRQNSFLRIEVPLPSYSERQQLWRHHLGRPGLDDRDLQELSSTFRLSGGQIRDAVLMARSLARWQGEQDDRLGLEAIYAACRAQSSGKLDSLAHKVKTTYAWDDIVLPADQVTQLREICLQVRHRQTVLETWGFDRHLAMGKGVNVLFAGQSGTGKTMAAEIVAGHLGLELYKIDLSMMVSKYIGETEKNLDRVFTAAREANAILFFDEADSIFGKRSEVKDAHDRYANIEVGYLLQKMEEYDGVVILSTNLRKNMDDAFVRRLHVTIDFPFPEEPDRLRIWRKVFPPHLPLADDLDLDFLARQFKLAGGNVRNIALFAAFLAADKGGRVGMAEVIWAIKREYQKLGKLVTEADFGPYLALARR
jgi:SpoVK/Ycf46/Vps4 family AAA+-type ATPase